VWHRITHEGTAWRFNRYADRVRKATGEDHPAPSSFEPPKPESRSGS
jgi:uncharacterized protein